MAEEYTLQYTGAQIDERLTKAGNAVLFTSQALSEAQKAQAKENLGVTDANFYVTATVVSGAEDDYECTADKTMAEITAAYNSNKSVYLRFSPVNANYLRIPLVTCQSGAIGFSLHAGGESAGSLGGGIWEALIEDDDSFFVTRKEVSGASGVYVLSDGESLDNVPESAVLVVDPGDTGGTGGDVEDTIPPGKASYNGVVLPIIPEELKASYTSFIIIISANNSTVLLASPEKWYYAGGKLMVPECTYCTNILEKDGWVFNKTYTDDGRYPFKTLIWSDHNIKDGSATATNIYFEGSVPVSAGGRAEEKPDVLYVRNPSTGKLEPLEVGSPDAVLYTQQTLTDEQKAQARENIGAADAKTVSQIAEKTSGEKIIASINMLTLDMASPKGEWWFNGVKYTSGNAITDASCSFRVPVAPNTTYFTMAYNADDLTACLNKIVYASWFDANDGFIAQADSNYLNTITSPANASYARLTYQLYAKASDEAISYLPYFSVESPPATYPETVVEPITFKTLQAEIDALKVEEISESLLHLPEKYDLVVGDTFELFYYGITNCASWDGLYMKVTGGKGKCFEKRFIYTPVAADVGTHKMTFELYDNSMTKLDEASVNLVVHAKATAPASEKVVLCVGDSLFNNGTIPDEFYRRLCGTGGTPAGDALTNITFIGTQRSATNDVPYEGYGGWTFGSYNTEFKQNSFVWITAANHGKTANDQHSVYKDSAGKLWKLETIETNRIKIIGDTVSQSIPSTSGTLTWVSGGTNQGNIVYSAAVVASGNPFWNEASGAVDFAKYATSQGVTQIDYAYVLLGWNNVGTSSDNYKTAATTFINNLLTAYPSCKIVLLGLQKPSLDGIGDNYGTNTTYNYQNMQDHVWVVDEVYKKIASEIANVSFINISGQFDTENNMMEWTRAVNARNSKTETYQSNGVHPAQSGSFQIADAAYRKFTADNA